MPSVAHPSPTRSPSWGAPLLILGAVLIAYLNSFLGLFQFDDFNVIVNDPAAHAWPGRLSDIRGIRPLLKLTYVLNWTSGLGLFGFHLVNLVVHAANALLVYALVRQAGRHVLEPVQARGAALIGALLFALHPVHTEAVTYISGRSSSLMTFFYLSSLLAYNHGREQGRKPGISVVSPLLFAFAVMTKEAALTLPLALLLWEVCFVRPREPVRLALGRQCGHWAIWLAAVVVIAVNPPYRELIALTPHFETVLTQVHGVSYLLSHLVLIDSLNIDPDLRMLAAWTWTLAGQAAALATALAAGLWGLRRRPWLGFGALWLFVQLLPTNTLVVRWDIANERQLYLAGVGLFIAAGIEIERLKALLSRRLVGAAIVMLCLVLGVFTFLRNHDYSSHVGLWEDAARKSPEKARVHNNLGYFYSLAGEREKARQSYLRALELKPDYDLARNNLLVLETGAKPNLK